MGDEKPTESQIAKHGKHLWDFIWDWRKEAKRHLEIGYDFAKKHPFSVLALVLITCMLTWMPVKYFDNNKLELVKGTYQGTNSFLEGQISTLTGQLKDQKEEYNQKINEDATTLANLKSDNNEKLRTKDVEIQKVTEERDTALLRVTSLEAMPVALLSAYTNLNANVPTNLNILTSFLENFTNSQNKDLGIPYFKLILNDHTEIAKYPQPNVFFSTNRSIFLTVKNDSDFSAEKLTITVRANLDLTNFICSHDWDSNKNRSSQGNVWTWEADRVLGGHNIFYATTFEISTNFQGIGLPFEIDLYSSTSKMHTYEVFFIFQQIPYNFYQNLTNVNPNANIKMY